MGIRRGAREGDGADSGGVGVDVLEDKLKLSEVDNLSSNPSVVSSWLLGSSTEKLHVTLFTQTATIQFEIQIQNIQHSKTQRVDNDIGGQ